MARNIEEDPIKKVMLMSFVGFLGIVGLIILAGCVVFIDAGERGVIKNWGAVTGDVFDEGLNFKVPIMQSVDKIDVKTRKIEVGATASSKDLQIVTSTIALNYHINPENVAWLRQNIGFDYQI